jgi:HAD superfamily hydrolase (TIGR01509 family)
MIQSYSAFLFDLNGTMIDDMRFHVTAWHRILNELGAGLTYEETKLQCYGRNDELLERIFPGRFTDQEKHELIMDKEVEYQAAFRPHLKLLPGLPELLEKARSKGIRMAIGSAALPFNIDYVLDGLHIRPYFDTVVSAVDVVHSKPDPETYLICARRLNQSAAQCLVFEDVPKGVEAAANANMKAFVLTTMHRPDEFAGYTNTIGYSHDYCTLLNDF